MAYLPSKHFIDQYRLKKGPPVEAIIESETIEYIRLIDRSKMRMSDLRHKITHEEYSQKKAYFLSTGQRIRIEYKLSYTFKTSKGDNVRGEVLSLSPWNLPPGSVIKVVYLERDPTINDEINNLVKNESSNVPIFIAGLIWFMFFPVVGLILFSRGHRIARIMRASGYGPQSLRSDDRRTNIFE